MPQDFSIQEYFSGSWSIEQGEPVRVKLKFLPAAARWLKEQQYHASPQITELVDGSALFEAEVTGRREITRWILGYGGDVQVLEPEDLREHIAGEAQRMAALYGGSFNGSST